VSSDIACWLANHAVEPTAPLALVHRRPWSTVFRVPTADGDLFLKQEQPVQAFEVPLTVALAERWPDRVPEVVAADTERAWLLLRNAGTNVAESGNTDVFPTALRLYGELQVGEAEHVDELLAIGLRDMRLPLVAAAYEPFFERDHGLGTAEVTQLLALAPRFHELCDQLTAFGLPASIQHDDLHQWNVFFRGERVAIYDWGDSSVAFPLWSWLKPLGAAHDYGLDPELLRAAYLEPWTAVAPQHDLRAAVDVAVPTGTFAYALQTRRQFNAMPDARDEYEQYLPQILRRLLARLDAA
jgi:Phosphotransferase enzyme family